MANRHDIMHRFANKKAGKNGTLVAGNVRYEGRNYYSYSTVFGQWVDTKKNVVIIYEGPTTISSNKHMLHKWLFPDDVNIFPYNDGGGSWNRYCGCNLCSYGEFEWQHRKELMNYYIDQIYTKFKAIKGGTKKGLEQVDFHHWEYVEKLCSLYRDTSVTKWIKSKRIELNDRQKAYWSGMRKLAKLLKAGERDVQTITDALFGKGTFEEYWKYCERYRKADAKKQHIINLKDYLGQCCAGFSNDELRKLSAKERLEIKFASLEKRQDFYAAEERDKRYKKNMANAYRYILGHEPVAENAWSGRLRKPTKCTNRFTGDTYDIGDEFIFGFYWAQTDMSFDYGSFRHSPDKEQWMRGYYAEFALAERNVKAIKILKRVQAHIHEKKRSYEDDRFINDDYLKASLTPGEYEICADFIARQDAHYVEAEARERANALRRKREAEEREKERKLQESVKKEQIDQLISQGVEGCRNLWRSHFMDICRAEYKSVETAPTESFYDGGNVLLRFNLNKDTIETSKHIRINIPTCKRMWKLVKAWHEDPSKFRQLKIKTLSGTYTIISYENDILTAGCHKISYTEMERMYNEILSNEKTA